jgi:hypothetical protein
MSPRLAPVIVASLAVLVVSGCAASAGAPASSVAASRPTFEPVPAPTEPTPSIGSPSPNAGDVNQGPGPLLSIELAGAETIKATLQDPAAKAWRLVIAGIGAQAGDRLELVVETGDVGPTILATEIDAGKVVDVMDLSGFADGTAAAGGCHRTLPVCVESDGFRLPTGGDGTFSVRLTLRDPAARLLVTGATATWPAEPFVLGTWTETESFPWGG